MSLCLGLARGGCCREGGFDGRSGTSQAAPDARLPAGFGDKPSWTKRRAGRQRRAGRNVTDERALSRAMGLPALLGRPSAPGSTGDREQVPVGLGCRWHRPEAHEPWGLIAESYVTPASCPEYSPGCLRTVVFEIAYRLDYVPLPTPAMPIS